MKMKKMSKMSKPNIEKTKKQMELFPKKETSNLELIDQFGKLLDQLKTVEIKQRIQILNKMKKLMVSISPFKDPVDNVQWVPAEKTRANDYNPNTVAPPEMKLLEISILEDGYTQPIVAFYDKDHDNYIIVDGFHRHRAGQENKEIKTRCNGYLPIVIIDKPLDHRMASTIRHNRARGKHAVKPMSEIVEDLIKLGWTDQMIGKELGMDADEVLRLKQRTGLPELFKDRDFSKSWIAKEIEDIENENSKI